MQDYACNGLNLCRGGSWIFDDDSSNLLGLGSCLSYLWDTPTIWANAVTMCVYSYFVFISIPLNFLFLFPSRSLPLKIHYRGHKLQSNVALQGTDSGEVPTNNNSEYPL